MYSLCSLLFSKKRMHLHRYWYNMDGVPAEPAELDVIKM